MDPPPPELPPPNEMTSTLASVILTANPTNSPTAAVCKLLWFARQLLFFRNANNEKPKPAPQPVAGNICVNKRDNAIPATTSLARIIRPMRRLTLIYARKTLNRCRGFSISSSMYSTILTTRFRMRIFRTDRCTPPNRPYTAKNPSPSSYYQANIVVETNRSLQLFAGGLTLSGGGVSTEWNQDGSKHKNTYYNGAFVEHGRLHGLPRKPRPEPLSRGRRLQRDSRARNFRHRPTRSSSDRDLPGPYARPT